MDAQFFAHPFGQGPGIFHGFFHGDAGNRHQRADIGSPETGMFAMMLAHVDELAGFLDGLESGFHDRIGLPYESHYGTVGGLSRVYVQELHAFDFFHFVGNLLDDRHVAPFAEVGHAFNDFFHCMLRIELIILFCKWFYGRS